MYHFTLNSMWFSYHCSRRSNCWSGGLWRRICTCSLSN